MLVPVGVARSHHWENQYKVCVAVSTDGSQTQVLCCYQHSTYQTQTQADIADVLTSTPHDYLCEPFFVSY